MLSLSNFWAACTPVWASQASSSGSACSLRPLMPPDALMSSMASCPAFLMALPGSAYGPEKGPVIPTLIGELGLLLVDVPHAATNSAPHAARLTIRNRRLIIGCPLPPIPSQALLRTRSCRSAANLVCRPLPGPPGRECADGRRPTPSSGTASIGTLPEPVNHLVPIEGPEDEEAHRTGPTPIRDLGAFWNEDCFAGPRHGISAFTHHRQLACLDEEHLVIRERPVGEFGILGEPHVAPAQLRRASTRDRASQLEPGDELLEGNVPVGQQLHLRLCRHLILLMSRERPAHRAENRAPAPRCRPRGPFGPRKDRSRPAVGGAAREHVPGCARRRPRGAGRSHRSGAEPRPHLGGGRRGCPTRWQTGGRSTPRRRRRPACASAEPVRPAGAANPPRAAAAPNPRRAAWPAASRRCAS